MIRRPPRSTLDRSSAASDVYKRQDLHFTQYEFTPIHVNPANTGGFLGTYRIGGVYRDQAASISGFGSDYRTPFLAIDVNFGFAFRPKDWTSLSISFFQDRSGEINLGKGGFLASGAYHLALGKGDLSIGAQFGSVSLNVKNPEKANTFQKISTGASGADEMKLQQAKANYQDIAGGLAYTAPITSSKHVLKVGLSSGHCLLYTSDAADERSSVDLGGRRIIKKNKKKNKSI
mgnify:CR=1 FL=1